MNAPTNTTNRRRVFWVSLACFSVYFALIQLANDPFYIALIMVSFMVILMCGMIYSIFGK